MNNVNPIAVRSSPSPAPAIPNTLVIKPSYLNPINKQDDREARNLPRLFDPDHTNPQPIIEESVGSVEQAPDAYSEGPENLIRIVFDKNLGHLLGYSSGLDSASWF